MRNDELEMKNENPYVSPEEPVAESVPECDPVAYTRLRKGLTWLYFSALVALLGLVECVVGTAVNEQTGSLFLQHAELGGMLLLAIFVMQVMGIFYCLLFVVQREMTGGVGLIIGSWVVTWGSFIAFIVLWGLSADTSKDWMEWPAGFGIAAGVWLWHVFLMRLAWRVKSRWCVVGVVVMMVMWLVMAGAWVRFWQVDDMLKGAYGSEPLLAERRMAEWALAVSCGVMLAVYMAVLLRLRNLLGKLESDGSAY